MNSKTDGGGSSSAKGDDTGSPYSSNSSPTTDYGFEPSPGFPYSSNSPPVSDTEEDSDAGRWGEESDTESLHDGMEVKVVKYGRMYMKWAEEFYRCPTDEKDNERLGLQNKLFHHVLKEQYFKQVYHSRQGDQARVLDIGTGTGEWAIGYADTYGDKVRVTGVDLRAIQPGLVPPNCFFEIYNCEDSWIWTNKFDYIRIAGTAGCFRDVQSVIIEAYKYLQPGGMLQMVDFDLCLQSYNGACSRDDFAFEFFQRHIEAAKKLGRPIDDVPRYHEMMKAAGFHLLYNDVVNIPISEWPSDGEQRVLGSLMQEFTTSDPEGTYTDRLVGGLKVTPEEVMVDCATIRKQLKATENKFYFPLHHLVGQKPEAEAGGSFPAAKGAEYGTQTPEESPEPPAMVPKALKRKADGDVDGEQKRVCQLG